MSANGGLDLAPYMAEVARRLFGEPNTKLSSKTTWRYGNFGSLAIEIEKGVWNNHELQIGGGVLDLINWKLGLNGSGAAALQWMRDQGILPSDDRPSRLNGHAARRIVAVYDYLDESGEHAFRVVRYDPKDFRQCRRATDADDPARIDRDGWVWSVTGVRQVPYRLPELQEAIGLDRTIVIVEGEKDVDNLWKVGVPATTNRGGAGKWPDDLNDFFRGADVVIVPDNDAAGRKHVAKVGAALKDVAASLRVLALPGLKEKGDVSDWLAAGGTTEEFYRLVDEDAIAWGVWRPPEDADHGDAERPRIAATPYRWIAPEKIPTRVWLYERHLIRRFFSLDVGAGAVGKTTNTIVELLSIAIGRNLFTGRPIRSARVWLWNGEDPFDELQRKIQAAALHYGICEADIGDRLLVDSGRKMPIVIAYEQHGNLTIATPVVDALTAEIKGKGIDVFYFDPFVRTHRLSENDNTKINAVAEQWAAIAEETNAAIAASHHVRKGNGAEVTVEDARGGVSLTAGARNVRTFQRMSAADAEKAGIPPRERKFFFRVDTGDKSNMSPPVEAATWRRLVSVALGNGTDTHPADEVGVATAWEWPNAFAGVTVADLDKIRVRLAAGTGRENPNANEWAGYVVADVLDLNASDPAVKAKIKSMLKTWIDNRELKTIRKPDRNGDDRPFIVPTGFSEASAP